MWRAFKLVAILLLLLFGFFSTFLGEPEVSATSLNTLRVTEALINFEASSKSPCPEARESPLPIPSALPPSQMIDFQKQVFKFLDEGGYKNWCKDKAVRDTGPFINDTYYGTHPAVRIYYSPQLIKWLMEDRKNPIPEGAMIIKKQYSPPAP